MDAMADLLEKTHSEATEASDGLIIYGNSLFDKLPTELIARIFTIGAEEIPKSYWYWGNSGRRGCLFVRTVSLVCRRWNAITRARSNAQLWHAWILLSCKPDGVLTLSTFSATLEKSNGVDIYLVINANTSSLSSRKLIDSWILDFKILAVALRILRKFAGQLVYVTVFWDTPHIAHLILRLLKGLDGCTRLHTVRMIRGLRGGVSHETTSAIMAGPAASALQNLEALYSVYGAWSSDAPRGLQCRSLLYDPGLRGDGLESVPSSRFITIGPTLETLKLWNWCSNISPCLWGVFIELIQSCPSLKQLAVDMRHVVMPKIDYIERLQAMFTKPPSPLRRLKLLGPPKAVLTLLTQYSYPFMIRLSLSILEGDGFDRNPAPEFTQPTLNLPALRCFKYFSSSEHGRLLLLMLAQNHQIHERIRLCTSVCERAWRIYSFGRPTASTIHDEPSSNPLPSPIEFGVVYSSNHDHTKYPYGLHWINISRTKTFSARLDGRLDPKPTSSEHDFITAPNLISIIVDASRSSYSWAQYHSFLTLVRSFNAPKLRTAVFGKGSGRECEQVKITFSHLGSGVHSSTAECLSLSWGQSGWLFISIETLEDRLFNRLKTLTLIVYTLDSYDPDERDGVGPPAILHRLANADNEEEDSTKSNVILPDLKNLQVDFRCIPDGNQISRMEASLCAVRDARLLLGRTLSSIVMMVVGQKPVSLVTGDQ
jgi:hypothetical protein